MKLKHSVNRHQEVACNECPHELAPRCPEQCPSVHDVWEVINTTSDWKENFIERYCDE